MNINIIFSDSSGGVREASKALSFALAANSISHSVCNLKDLHNSFIVSIVRAFFKYIKKRENLFIMQHFDAISLGVILGFLGCKKIINVVHTDLLAYYKSSGVIKRIVVRILVFLIRNKVVVFVSKEAMLRAKGFFKLSNAYYIYNMLPSVGQCNFRRVLRFCDGGEICLGVVARLHKSKNIDLAVRLVKKINVDGYRVRLIVFGDGPERERLILYINCLGCANLVTLAGYGSDKNQMFQCFDALISFSSLEGFPLTVAEAIRYKKPVFHTDCSSGPRELMSPDKNPLIKTESYEETSCGFLVKMLPENVVKSYSVELSEEEMPYVDYLKNFINKVLGNEFSFSDVSKEFDNEYILRQWVDLLMAVEGSRFESVDMSRS